MIFHSLERPWRERAMRCALAIFVAMRLFTSAVAGLALWITAAPTAPDPVLRPYQGITPINEELAGYLLGGWQRFDTLWYLKIATRGYSPQDGSTVYFPLYSLLIRAGGKILLGNYLLVALIISNLAHIGLLFYLYRLTTSLLEAETARRTVVYLAIFPTTFLFLAGYTESLFILFPLAAFRYAHWLAAHTSGDNTAFTTYWTGSYIAARAATRVFLGHWAETMNYVQKMEKAKTFFGQASDEWRKALSRDHNISYLFHGPREKALPGFEETLSRGELLQSLGDHLSRSYIKGRIDAGLAP